MGICKSVLSSLEYFKYSFLLLRISMILYANDLRFNVYMPHRTFHNEHVQHWTKTINF